MLTLAPDWEIPESDLTLSFVRSSGPGGQNVNKVATKAELRLHLSATNALSAGQKQRLCAAFPSHATRDGDFLVTGDRYRTQRQNEADVRERLAAMLLCVRWPPPPRRPTLPTRASKRRRVATKRERGAVKEGRRRPPAHD